MNLKGHMAHRFGVPFFFSRVAATSSSEELSQNNPGAHPTQACIQSNERLPFPVQSFRRRRPNARKSASQAVLNIRRMPLTPRATRRIPHDGSREIQALSVCLVGEKPAVLRPGIEGVR